MDVETHPYFRVDWSQLQVSVADMRYVELVWEGDYSITAMKVRLKSHNEPRNCLHGHLI